MRINIAAGTIKCLYENGNFSQKKNIFLIIHSVKIYWQEVCHSLFIIKNVQFYPLKEKLHKKIDK